MPVQNKKDFSDTANTGQMLCVGVIGKSHGLKGQVRVRSYTEYPEDIVSYGPLQNEDGSKTFEMTIVGEKKDCFLMKIEGINSKEDADLVKGEKLYISRDILPEPEEDEFYYSDLIGLEVFEKENSTGKITAVHNFGAGDLLEIKGHDDSVSMLLFNKENVPEIDLKNGRVSITRPKETTDDKDKGNGQES